MPTWAAALWMRGRTRIAGFLSNGWHGEGRRPSAIQPSGPAGLRNLPLMNNLRIGQDQGAAGPPAGPPADPASRQGPLVRIDELEVVVVEAVERGAEFASHLDGIVVLHVLDFRSEEHTSE